MSGVWVEVAVIAAAVLVMAGICYFESWSRSMTDTRPVREFAPFDGPVRR